MISFRLAALAAVMSFGMSAALAQTATGPTACPLNQPNYGACSTVVGASAPVQLTQTGYKHYQRIVNNSVSGTLHCTRDPGVTASVNGIGTFPIPAGKAEEFTLPGTGVVPYPGTSCIGDTAGIPVSVEVY